MTSTELFKLLPEHYRGDYQRFVTQKITPVVGDVAHENLRIEVSIKEQMWAKVDIVVNIATTTTFYERYDVAMKVSTLGAKNVIEFCKACCKLQIRCHISMGYVNIGRMGIITEEVMKMGERISDDLINIIFIC
eukprot:Gb_13483 [translate_table: standard]